jgi:8-oxo-dGTP pyrophosphatase MutT (NUDIX family)
MIGSRIRPIALCLFRHEGSILVNQSRDTVKNQAFCRLIGGGIEFGETGATAVAREVREELDAEVENVRFVGMLENIFTYNGTQGHEIALIYDAEFVDRRFYARASIPGIESNGHPFQAVWRRIDAFSVALPIYPDGVLGMLQSRPEHAAAR